MSKHIVRKTTLALTLMLPVLMTGRAFADSDCGDAACIVNGTSPQPQVVSGDASTSAIVYSELALIVALGMA